MNAGFGMADITPQHRMRLAGFSARTGWADGANDPLLAFASYFEDGSQRLLMVALDHLGLARSESAPLRRAIARATGVAEENVWIHCTHTHGGPEQDARYLAALEEKLSCAAVEAIKSVEPCAFACSSAALRGHWFHNRRALTSGFQPVDDTASLGAFFAGGRLRAIIYSAACHPACLGNRNMLYTADWPGFVRSAIWKKPGMEGIPVIFCQGTSGDINTGYSAGLFAVGREASSRTYGRAKEIGESVAADLLQALPQLKPEEGAALRVACTRIGAEYYKEPHVEEFELRCASVRSFLETAKAGCYSRELTDALEIELAYLGFARERNLENAGEKRSYELELNAARLGDMLVAGFPGEFFVNTGLELKRQFPDRVVHCMTMTNDYQGYFPPCQAFEEGGYEPLTARFAPVTAEDCLHQLALLLRSLG